MTFEFVPDWIERMRRQEYSAGAPISMQRPGLLAGAVACSTPAEVATLVSELFTEGTLTWQQLCSLEALPELKAHLSPSVAAVPAARRLLPPKR